MRGIELRLRKLEGAVVADRPSWFQVVGRSTQECDTQISELIASGKAKHTDGFGSRLIVYPPDHRVSQALA